MGTDWTTKPARSEQTTSTPIRIITLILMHAATQQAAEQRTEVSLVVGPVPALFRCFSCGVHQMCLLREPHILCMPADNMRSSAALRSDSYDALHWKTLDRYWYAASQVMLCRGACMHATLWETVLQNSYHTGHILWTAVNNGKVPARS